MNKSSAITAIKICQLFVITRFYFLSQKDGLRSKISLVDGLLMFGNESFTSFQAMIDF
jgi:hypothetical protein